MDTIKQKVIDLRKSGVYVSEICKRLKITHSTAYRYLKGYKFPIAHPNYKTSLIDHNYFSFENLKLFPERYVILGFIAADGCVSHRGNSKNLVFNISKKDSECLDIINKEICSGQRKISDISCTNSRMLSIPSINICNDLSNFGIVPRKTSIFRLPKLNEIDMRYFIRGYHYGDGNFYVYKKTNRPRYSFLMNNEIAQDFKSYFSKKNIYVCIANRNQDYKQVIIQGKKHAKSFSEFVFNNNKMILIKRKHTKIL